MRGVFPSAPMTAMAWTVIATNTTSSVRSPVKVNLPTASGLEWPTTLRRQNAKAEMRFEQGHEGQWLPGMGEERHPPFNLLLDPGRCGVHHLAHVAQNSLRKWRHLCDMPVRTRILGHVCFR